MRACGQLASPPNPRPSDAYRALRHILPTVATADTTTRREPINKANDREPVALVRGVLIMTFAPATPSLRRMLVKARSGGQGRERATAIS
jgi:hypothetical protein